MSFLHILAIAGVIVLSLAALAAVLGFFGLLTDEFPPDVEGYVFLVVAAVALTAYLGLVLWLWTLVS